jgi:hypothetical protein
MVITNL